MALSVSRARVKEKCGIADADFDDTIDNLILEITPVVEQLIRAEALDDPAVGVQSTLTLAATEIHGGVLASDRPGSGGRGNHLHGESPSGAEH